LSAPAGGRIGLLLQKQISPQNSDEHTALGLKIKAIEITD
jgi:hypothetical protein